MALLLHVTALPPTTIPWVLPLVAVPVVLLWSLPITSTFPVVIVPVLVVPLVAMLVVSLIAVLVVSEHFIPLGSISIRTVPVPLAVVVSEVLSSEASPAG